MSAIAVRRVPTGMLRLGDALRRGSPLPQIVFAPPAFGRWIAAGATPAAYTTGLVSRDEVRGLSPDEFLPEAVVGPLLEAFADLGQLGSAVTSYEQFLSLSGVESWWLVTVTRTAPRRARSMLVATFLNLDFVYGIEVALRRSEENFRGLIESLPDAVFVVADGASLVYANKAAAALLRYQAPPDLVARPWRGLFDPGSVPHVEALIAECNASGAATVAHEVTMRSATGTEIPVEVAVVPALFDGGKTDVVIARDVHERQRARAQLALANRMIALGTMAAGVAHELNNPISYVQTNIEFVEAELRETTDGRRLDLAEMATALREAAAGVAHAKRIVEELKGLSPSRAAPKPVVLAGAVDAAVRMTRDQARGRATLDVRHEDGGEVEADFDRLVQVFVNLLVNAAHAIEPGAPEQNVIAVRTRSSGAHAVVDVTDTGAGIPGPLIERLFDPFFTTKPAGLGTGLGLTICQKVVADLGGRIEVESSMGRGSTFRVLLPRAGAARPAAVAGAARPRLLLVDDDALVGRALTRLLRNEYDIVYRQQARDALALLESGAEFDIVLCDLVMPGMSGMDLYDAIRGTRPEVASRVIFLSGATHVAAARDFLLGIPNDWLEKPIDERTLAAALASKLR